MKHYLLIITVLFLLTAAEKTFCQDNLSDDMKDAITSVHTAYIENDFKAFMQNHSYFERVLSMEPENALARYYMAYIEYRLLQFSQSDPKLDVEKYYDSGLDICRQLLDKKQLVPETETLMAGFYMMRLATNQMEAVALTPKIFELVADAEAAPENNPRPLIVKGIMLLNMPPMFGGSVEKAIESFSKAVSMYEEEKAVKPIRWGYEETLAWLGQAYEKNNQIDKARETYEKALKLEPEFRWVKYRLLPALDQNKQN